MDWATWRSAGRGQDGILNSRISACGPRTMAAWVPYRSQHELVFVFKHGRVPHRNNVMLGMHGRTGATSGTIRREFVLALRRRGQSARLTPHRQTGCHDRQRDHGLHRTARYCARRLSGERQYLIAAERTGRRSFGLELDPLYVDGIVRRWQAFTRNSARLASWANFQRIGGRGG